ncbi:hypothetical protein [Streptomyces angustmyceticus]|uniref:hypothetical protein n=1 Tax=Streptomyces angustmyceticus TaxID=285578 RepID=UPI00344DAF83
MSYHRHECHACGRDIAVTNRGRLCRHDPPVRDRDLKSCPGSLKVVHPKKDQPAMLAYMPPLFPAHPDDPGQLVVDQAALF